MKLRNWLTLAGITLATFGAGLAINSFLPRRLATVCWPETETGASPPDASTLPEVDVTILRCGHVTIPTCTAVRGASPFASCVIAYSCVLVRHPKATFLYDTGFCSAIHSYMAGRSALFRMVQGNFIFERSISEHLKQLDTEIDDLDFALLSHLHYDHVSGIPDLPGVPLRINRVEYDAARLGLLDANQGLVRRLLSNNPIELFDCAGPAYEGFRCSHDLFGDGSIVLVPLPGHTAGNTGMFINRSNGPRIFLLGDAAWVAQNYLRPATMHPFIWSMVTGDDATARQTLIELHRFSQRHPEIVMIPMHDAEIQAAFAP